LVWCPPAPGEDRPRRGSSGRRAAGPVAAVVRDRPPDRADRRRSVVAADAPRHRGRAGEGGPRLRGAPIAAAGREDHPARSDAAREVLTRITRAGTTDPPG